MDMKLMTWVPPREIPDVGISPVSLGATLGVLMICLDSPDCHAGEPEYLSEGQLGVMWITCDRSWSEVRKRWSVLFGPCIPVTQSTREAGAPPMLAGGAGAGCAAGCGAGCGCTG